MIASLWSLFVFVLEIILFVALLCSLVTHFMVWFEMRLKEMQSESNTAIPWKTLLVNFFTESLCNFILAFSLPLPKLADYFVYRPPLNPLSPPILLVHGYLQNQTSWVWFRHHLQAIDGVGPIYMINLPVYTRSIAEHAALLQSKIEQIKHETQNNQVILIGHSRGGLVASYYSEFLAPKEEVAAVITLGTPFRGTTQAVFGFKDNAREMAPYAPILTKLNESIQRASIPYYTIASKIDNLVIPWHSACPWEQSNSENSLILENFGHLRFLISPRVVTQVAEWILPGGVEKSQSENANN